MKTYIARATPWGTIQTGPGFRHLTALEQAAVLAHEHGHIAHGHPWKRLLWVLTLRVFFDFSGFLAMCERQEFEADQYAVKQGHKHGLVSFLFCRQFQGPAPGYPSAKARLEALNG